MNADQILTEIREANLSYLMLAQSLIRTDKEQALYRLGVSEESAAMIALLTPAQMMKVASGNTLTVSAEPLRSVDAGGEAAFDAIGRLVDVWRPDAPHVWGHGR